MSQIQESSEKPYPETSPEESTSIPDLASLIDSLGGQEGITAKINSLLGKSDVTEAPLTGQAGANIPDLSSLLSGSATGLLSGLSGLSGKPTSPCSRLCALVTALSPFLSPARRSRADKAVQILQLLGSTEKPVIEDDRLPLIMLLIYLFFLP